MKKILLNGREHNFETDKTIAELLKDLKLPSGGLAVAVNDEIVSHDMHETCILNDGDSVEIIKAMGGG